MSCLFAQLSQFYVAHIARSLNTLFSALCTLLPFATLNNSRRQSHLLRRHHARLSTMLAPPWCTLTPAGQQIALSTARNVSIFWGCAQIRNEIKRSTNIQSRWSECVCVCCKCVHVCVWLCVCTAECKFFCLRATKPELTAWPSIPHLYCLVRSPLSPLPLP